MGKNSSGFRLSTFDCLRRAQNLKSVWSLTAKLCAGCRTHSWGIPLFDFRLSTLDCLMRAEDFQSVWLDFRFRIASTRDVPPTAYCPFGILGAAEVMRVFQSEFFDASQKYDELSALASCWL
jgi:hypothetical protein